MPNYTAEIIDIEKALAKQQAPAVHLGVPDGEVWYVRHQPFDFDGEPAFDGAKWGLNRIHDGNMVLVPLLPYRTTSTEPQELIAGALDLMQRYCWQLAEHVTDDVVRTHVVIGKPVEDLRPEYEAFRYWVGFAARIH